MKGHYVDLPCLRLRCAGWRLLYVLREQVRPIKYDTEEIERTAREMERKTFRFHKGYAGAWRLTVR